MVAGFQSRLGTIKTEFKSIYDQLGQPITISGENVTRLNQVAGSVRELTAEQKKLTDAEKQALSFKRQLSTQLAKMTPENIKAAAALREHRQATNQLITEQQKLNGTYKPGVISSFIASIKNLAVAYLGLNSAISLVKNIFTTTKELNVLGQSYKYLVNDVNELAKTQGFLTDITKRYGLEVISTSQSYLKFRAAITGSNFDLVEARKIFESVSKAGSVLGLNAQRMELVFLALEQMISKGTISTEELRRQLGDNLPGAMRIMADALNVTIPQLMKMIKNNEVLAQDALPKFAVALEKAYGIQSVKTIDNLQTAVNDLKNGWTLFVESLKASGTFKSILKSLADEFEMLRFAMNPDQFVKDAGKGQGLSMLNSFIDKTKQLKTEEEQRLAIQKRINDAINEANQLQFEINPIESKNSRSTEELKILRTKKAQQEANKVLITELQILLASQDDFAKAFKKASGVAPVTDETLDKLRRELELATGIIERLEAKKALYEYNVKKATDPVIIEQINKEILALDNEIKYYKDLGKAIESNIKKQTFNRKSTDPAHINEMEDVMQKLDQRNQKIENDRQALYERMGLLDQEFYANDLRFLEEWHQKGNSSDQEYLVQRISLWMSYNEDLINATQQFAEQFLNLLDELNQGKIDAAQKEVDAQEEKLNTLKSQLDEEKKLKDEGKANDYDRLVDSIAQTQSVRDKANKDLERAQKRQAQIQLAAQASDIVTASANIIEAYSDIPIVGVILGLAAVASMIAAFSAYKNKINSISKYGEGEVDITGDAKPHSQGGKIVEIERHESVINAESTMRSKRLLEAVNDGVLSDIDLFKLNFSHNLTDSNYQRYDSTSEMLAELKKTRQSSEDLVKYFTEKVDYLTLKDGSILQIKGNSTKIIRLQ